MALSLWPVVTERLSLPLWSASDVAAIRGGTRLPAWHRDFPRRDDVDAASLWHEGDVWGPRSIVRGATVLGSIGFFGPPASPEDEVEVGYGLVAEASGWGFATEALLGVLAQVDGPVRATVAAENARSLRVLAKCGFTQLRGVTDDGLVMVRPPQETPLHSGA